MKEVYYEPTGMGNNPEVCHGDVSTDTLRRFVSRFCVMGLCHGDVSADTKCVS